MAHVTQVIKKPILTEKSYIGMEDGKYTFEVDRKANKTQVKKAFETIFEVKVEKVNIVNLPGKKKRVGKYEGKTSPVKKAIIKLKEGETLEIFGQDAE